METDVDRLLASARQQIQSALENVNKIIIEPDKLEEIHSDHRANVKEAHALLMQVRELLH